MTQIPNKPASAPGGLDPRHLWKRKGLILGVTVLSVAIGAAYLLVAEDVYEVKTRLFLNKEADPTKVIQDGGREDRFFAGSQAEIIGSPSIVREALQRAPVTLPPGSDDDLLTYVLESLTVSPVVNTQVLSIHYQGPNPEEAERFVEALVASYKEYLKSIDTSSSTEAVELLAQREAQLHAKLEQLEQQYAELRRTSPLIGQSDKQLEAHTLVLANVSEALTAARVRHIELKNQLLALSAEKDGDSAVASAVSYHRAARPDASSGEMVDPSEGAALRINPNKLSQELSRSPLGYEGEGADGLIEVESQLRLAILKKSLAREKLGDSHPMHRETDAEVAMWQRIRDNSLAMAIESLQKQLEIEAATEAQLSELYERERKKAKELDDHLVQEQVLLSEIARTEEVYSAVFNRLTDSQLVNQALSSGRASVEVRDLDGPRLLAEKLWPQPVVLLPACAIFGLALGILAAFTADATRERPRHPAPLPNGAMLDARYGSLQLQEAHP